jgi:hypothetical protein
MYPASASAFGGASLTHAWLTFIVDSAALSGAKPKLIIKPKMIDLDNFTM